MKRSILVAVAEAAGLTATGAAPVTPDKPALPTRPAQPAPAPVAAVAAVAELRPAAVPSIAERVIREWKTDAAIRAEFQTFGDYSAWRSRQLCKAEGIAREEFLASAPDVSGYVASCEARSGALPETEKLAIAAYADTWRKNAAIRREFGTFEVFASYMRAESRGAARTVNRH